MEEFFLTFLRAVLSSLLVDKVHSLGLCELVDLPSDEASEKLLGESVGHGFTYFEGSCQQASCLVLEISAICRLYVDYHLPSLR